MSTLDGDSQILDLLKMMVEVVQQENRRLHEELADDRLRARSQRERFVDQLLQLIPNLLPRFFAQGPTPGPWEAPPPGATRDRARAPQPNSPGATPKNARTPDEAPVSPAADQPKTAVYHWLYMNGAVGCGQNIDHHLTTVRHEVTCTGCHARLCADELLKLQGVLDNWQTWLDNCNKAMAGRFLPPLERQVHRDLGQIRQLRALLHDMLKDMGQQAV